MRLTAIFSALCAAALAQASQRTAQIYIQPIVETSSEPTPLGEIAYDASQPSAASVVSYEAPDIPPSALVRVGLYDEKSSRWISGTTVASADNFGKGLAPNMMLWVDEGGEVLSAACRGVRIDAGQTRDFGPQALVIREERGKGPELNKPVLLSPEGKKVGEEPEKTFLQKYWWMIGIAVFVAMSGGGGAEK